MQLTQLMENFEVENILFREYHLDKIEHVFNNYKEFGVSTNLMICGVTGSGKTLCLKKIIQKHPSEHIYISAGLKKRSNQILSLISKVNIRNSEVLIEKTIEELKKEKKVIVIDELNKVQDAKIFFDDLNTIYRETGVPIILITNNPLLMNSMAEDARLTLLFSRIDFRAYNSLELIEICKQRVSLLPKEMVKGIEESTIPKICAYAGKSGSARRALGLLRKCILAGKFSQEEVDALVKNEEYISLQTFVGSMNEVERSFLSELIEIYVKKINDLENPESTDEVYITPKEIQESLPTINISKISQLITLFENEYGFLITSYIQKGRMGGRYRKIDFVNRETFQQLEAVL